MKLGLALRGLGVTLSVTDAWGLRQAPRILYILCRPSTSSRRNCWGKEGGEGWLDLVPTQGSKLSELLQSEVGREQLVLRGGPRLHADTPRVESGSVYHSRDRPFALSFLRGGVWKGAPLPLGCRDEHVRGAPAPPDRGGRLSVLPAFREARRKDGAEIRRQSCPARAEKAPTPSPPPESLQTFLCTRWTGHSCRLLSPRPPAELRIALPGPGRCPLNYVPTEPEPTASRPCLCRPSACGRGVEGVGGDTFPGIPWGICSCESTLGFSDRRCSDLC